MCSPVLLYKLPADAASLRETDRYMYIPRGPVASCDVMCCINALADGAEGLHFSAFLVDSALICRLITHMMVT